MKKKVALTAFLIACAMFIAGLAVIFCSPAIGRGAGSSAIRSNGGHMDTSQYEKVIDSTTVSFQIGGAIISLVGGLGLLASGYEFYKAM